MMSNYSCRLKVDENVGPEQKVGEFINFLPVLAYDGSAMRPVSAADILDIAMAGTSATLLARRWESALLVNVDNDTLRRILNNEDALNALMSIEGFRALNADIETIINRSEAIKKAKREKEELTPKEKKEISAEEKELKSKRKQIQEKLVKFATRISVLMYLTDYREETLKDVITQLEPGLFKKVTGLTVQDFELLVSLGVFNDALMNDAVYKFRRYEDSSLSYAGVNRHEGESVGLFDTTLTDFEYMAMVQEESMVAPNGLARPTASASDTTSVSQAAGRTATKTSAATPAAPASMAKSPEFTPAKSEGNSVSAATPAIEEAISAKPAVTQEQLDALSEGDAVFHKAFGYGRIIGLNDSYIEVTFDSDNKKKPSRKFMFPSTFYQGLLHAV
ncbi:MAG: hypothetical protein SPD98_07515 [Tractidigestivibacter sp.]|uniref:hypothetical protein n=1 Tax=Tractidigestivibacter sp. TaxID=2847320 RepID=UPI002A817466|nr:hypothetical protein [Tractidigestivibacter sp.]MDY4535079.1 hypothetical protein [Tractidigestivibacter sp.]